MAKQQSKAGSAPRKMKKLGNTPETIATSAYHISAGGQKHQKFAANDPVEAQYWEALNAQVCTAQKTGTEAKLCDIYYFHTDQVGLPQELSNSQGQLVWQVSYKTWGNTVSEEWEVKSLANQPVHAMDQGDIPKIEEEKQQNLRFQGQYLDRETGVHYNTFRFYDADIGRFISPDPIGLLGGMNTQTYTPNPLTWIDPLGWIDEKTPGYNVYGLYEKGASKPYYVGITDDLGRRGAEHRGTGQLPANAEMRPISRNVTYGEARGIERAKIEQFGTKTGKIGTTPGDLGSEDFKGRGNKNLGFDVNSKTRPTPRQNLITNRFIVSPSVDLEWSASDIDTTVRRGAYQVDVGVQARYEFNRRVAPYLGLKRTFYPRSQSGGETAATQWQAGLRLLF